jgi:TolA-binding protein
MNVMRKEVWRSLACGLLWAFVMSGCGLFNPSSSTPSASVANTSDPAVVDSGVVQALQKQIRERDRRIAELTSQLEVLKVIDQDMEERRKSSRLPATLTPSATDHGR